MQIFDGDIYKGWTEYCTHGGMPMTLSMSTGEQKECYLQRLLTETCLKNVVTRNAVAKPQALEELVAGFAALLATNGASFTLLWSGFGSSLNGLFLCHTKAVNTVLALLLIYCAVAIFF